MADDPKIIDGRRAISSASGAYCVGGIPSRFANRNHLRCIISPVVIHRAGQGAGCWNSRRRSQICLTPVLVGNICNSYAKTQGTGKRFGYGMVYPDNPESVARVICSLLQRWCRNFLRSIVVGIWRRRGEFRRCWQPTTSSPTHAEVRAFNGILRRRKTGASSGYLSADAQAYRRIWQLRGGAGILLR